MAKILVVDDEQTYLQIALQTLTAAGHVVTLASLPRIAIELVAADVPDLIVSDINMPDMTGFELATIVNAQSTRHWIPVVFMSARSDGDSFREAFAVGAIDYLVKPFSRQSLVDTIERKLLEFNRRRSTVMLPQPASETMKADTLPGLPGYDLISPLGSGGMGHVYLADNIKTGIRSAVKVLTLVEEGKDQTDALTRFLEERAMLARIDHPNVAKVFDHGISDAHVYIAMEFFPCGDLKFALERGISVATALNYVGQIAQGLSAIHAAGVVHRDIKPANIMLRDDGSIAIVDFGIAKALDAVSALTRHNETLGTPHYMSPEQINGAKLDGRSDLYCVGVIFYEMLTRQRLFAGDRLESILMQHLHAPRPILPRSLSILQPLLDMLLAIDPANRFQDAAAFLQALSVAEQMRFSEHTDADNKSFLGMSESDSV